MSRDDAEMLAQLQAENRPDTTSAGLILACVALAAVLWIAGIAWLMKFVAFVERHPDASRIAAMLLALALIIGALSWIDWQTVKMTREHDDQVGGYEP